VLPLAFFWRKKEITIPFSRWWINLGGLVLLLAIPSMLYLTKGQEEHYATVADESRDYFSRDGVWRRAVKSSGAVRCDRAPIQQYKLCDHRGAE